jgi:hypothetical protein
VNANGKSREIVIETRPEFAIVQLNGTKEQYPLPWEKIYKVALEHHEKNLRLEAQAANATQRIVKRHIETCKFGSSLRTAAELAKRAGNNRSGWKP